MIDRAVFYRCGCVEGLVYPSADTHDKCGGFGWIREEGPDRRSRLVAEGWTDCETCEGDGRCNNPSSYQESDPCSPRTCNYRCAVCVDGLVPPAWEVEAAARAHEATERMHALQDPQWDAYGKRLRNGLLLSMRAALVAAERATPPLTGDCETDCQDECAYPGQFSECELGATPPKEGE